MPVQNEQQPGPALSDEYSAEWSEKKIFVQWLCISAWQTQEHTKACTEMHSAVAYKKVLLLANNNVGGPYRTLAYGEDVLPPSAEASNGPNAHPRINRKVKNPQVQYSPGSIPTLGTIPLPREGPLTWNYLLTCTLGISKRTRISARKHIHPGHHD